MILPTPAPCYNIPMRVIFFDIDGTLIRSGGAGKAAMEAALRDAFGVREVRGDIPFSGRTDRAIGRDLLAAHGIEPTPENRARLEAAYLEHLPGSLARVAGCVLPGVAALMAELAARERMALGLLTGNVRRGARAKLSHYGLWDYFPFGGFGDRHFERDDVAREALSEAARHLGRPPDPSDVWVVGDTPLDVRCARAIGAKAVAVATGWHSPEELAAARPDWLLADFSDPAELLAAWG
ncbi:MAG TPA: HAD family hydrolase [Gemmataceae bacterium]